VAAVAVGLPVMALAACGSSGTAAAPSDGIPKVSSPPSAAALATVERAVAGTMRLTGAYELAFSNAPADSRSVTPRDARGAVAFGGPESTIQLDLPPGSGGAERMVFLPGTVFIKPPPTSLPLQPGRPWIFANFADIDKYRVKLPPYIVQTESVNPAFVLYELSWGATSAVPIGPTALGHQTPEAYVVTVDLNRAQANRAGPAAAVFGHALSAEISSFGGTTTAAPPTMTVEVWVDHAGRVIGSRAAPPGAGIGTLTLTVTRFGAPVHADKPPRAQVVDIAAMIPGGEQEALNGTDADGA
jgi:hypothetical protein